MTALSKAALQALWVQFFQPTQADFANLIDSWTDYSPALEVFGAKVSGGSTGVPNVVSSTSVAFVALGATGSQIMSLTSEPVPLSLGGTGQTTLASAKVSFGVVSATETQIGVVEIATQAEANTGTADDKVLTPAKLASISPTSVTYDSSDQVLILDASDSNKLKRATITTSLSPSIDIYSASATWVCPTGVSKVVLTAVGGGGGGGSNASGGTGGYGISVVTVSAGTTYVVSVGAGGNGNGGGTGGAGVATWFGVNSSSKLIESTGGGGGSGSTGANGTSTGTSVQRSNAALHFIFGGTSPRAVNATAVAWSSSPSTLHAGAAGGSDGVGNAYGAVGGALMIEYWS
jgi:hypothetical protein